MQIFLDLDGVVSDFLSASLHHEEWSDLFRVADVKESEVYDYKFYELAGIETDEWQNWLHQSDEEFWANIPPTREAEGILDCVERFGGDRWKFLSHAPNNGAKIGKRCFIRSKLGRPSSNLICVDNPDDKARFCTGPECVLIDDMIPNCEAWVEAGGVAIMWETKYNRGKNKGFPAADSVEELEACLSAVDMASNLLTVQEPTQGRKGSKPERLDLLPPSALCELARVYNFGASKYEPNNYRKGYDWSLSIAALLRHVFAFQEGEDDDEESGFSHLAHAAFHCLAIIKSIHDHGDRFDDRFRREV